MVLMIKKIMNMIKKTQGETSRKNKYTIHSKMG